MLTYVYESDQGDMLERSFDVGEAPSALVEGGTTYRLRKISDGAAPSTDDSSPSFHTLPKFWPYRAVSQRRNAPGLKHDKRGNPYVDSRRMERDYAKREGKEWT